MYRAELRLFSFFSSRFSLSFSNSFSNQKLSVLVLLLGLLASLSTGCGGGKMSGPPPLTGNTQVTIVLSSTANAQLTSFGVGISGITLTSQSGKTVTLLSEPQGSEQWAEFIHVNGDAEPLLTVSVPQDIYTSASVSVDQSYFDCVALTPDGALSTNFYGYGSNPNNAPQTDVTVTVASPITITGNSMGLVLDLQAARSATFSSCYGANGPVTYSITPAFNLRPMTLASQPTNPSNGKALQLHGEVTALGTSDGSFILTLPNLEARTLAVSTNSATVYQGVSGTSALTMGMFIEMDGAIQSDGSLKATRIAVNDASAVDVQSGPVVIVSDSEPEYNQPAARIYNTQSQGADTVPGVWAYNVYFATFQISGQLNNLQSLPFVPSFSAANMVAGQNVYVSMLQFTTPNDPYTHANTVTLIPQTINGTVLGSSMAGNFTDYTISLASYDLFPQLAVQQGQPTRLTNPSVVEVYVDNNTQKLNTQPLAAGSTLRFYGMVFNDNGTLRMDCAQVNDGVALTPAASANQVSHMARGTVQQIRRDGPGTIRQTITVTRGQ